MAPGEDVFHVDQKAVAIMKKYELDIRLQLRSTRFMIKSKHELKGKLSKRQIRKLKEKIQNNELGNNKQANPFLIIVVSHMCFKAWFEYTRDLKQKFKFYQDNG